MENNFHFQDTCNSIIHVIGKEMNVENSIRLSLDVQLPPYVSGDEQGLKYSLTRIIKFCRIRIKQLMIDIKIGEVRHDHKTIWVRIDIRGKSQKNLSIKKKGFKNPMKLGWIKKMPYTTSFSQHSDSCFFSFEMSFLHAGMHTKSPESSFLHKRILLAEDNEMSASVFSSFLEEWGCKLTWVSRGKDALYIFESNIFDLILMDGYMPDLNGNQVIKKIRARDAKIPIIALISSSLEKDIFKSSTIGVNDFLLKPISSSQLKLILQKYLQ